MKLESDGSGVDASYAVHPVTQVEPCQWVSVGTICIVATGHKLVACSSTESELIGVHYVMPQIIWTSYFLHAQGQHICH